jgi:hypothetical protein
MTSKHFWVVCAFFCASSYAVAGDQPLANLIATLKDRSSDAPNPISVSAVGFVQGQELILKFTLTNVSTKSLSVYPESLPWGNTHAIQWAALTSDGRVVPLVYPIDDPAPAKEVQIRPRQTLTGSYHLSSMLVRETVPIDTDLLIVWAYRFPAATIDGQASRPISTGVAVLHTPK